MLSELRKIDSEMRKSTMRQENNVPSRITTEEHIGDVGEPTFDVSTVVSDEAMSDVMSSQFMYEICDWI